MFGVLLNNYADILKNADSYIGKKKKSITYNSHHVHQMQ